MSEYCKWTGYNVRTRAYNVILCNILYHLSLTITESATPKKKTEPNYLVLVSFPGCTFFQHLLIWIPSKLLILILLFCTSFFWNDNTHFPVSHLGWQRGYVETRACSFVGRRVCISCVKRWSLPSDLKTLLIFIMVLVCFFYLHFCNENNSHLAHYC